MADGVLYPDRDRRVWADLVEPAPVSLAEQAAAHRRATMLALVRLAATQDATRFVPLISDVPLMTRAAQWRSRQGAHR